MTTEIAVHVKTFKIDGLDVSARENETILQVAQENGIFIPTLCKVDGLSSVGACRLCLVEIKGRPKLFPACTLPAEEGIDVITQSDTLAKYRRMILGDYPSSTKISSDGRLKKCQWGQWVTTGRLKPELEPQETWRNQ